MKTLIVEDDKTLADILAFTFIREGFSVIQADNGLAALTLWEQDQPDLVLLDVNIPLPDGFSVCETIRKKLDTPIILLTVRADEEDIVHGLDLGADDYITKPFSPRQLMARVHAVLRRANEEPAQTFRQAGQIALDLPGRCLKIGEFAPVSLTTLECRLIDCLMINAGQIVPPETLLHHIWGPQSANNDMLRQLIHRFCKKIKTISPGCIIIENTPGLGYSLVLQQDSSDD
jgi:DNA-binding response OmpR family regulator